MPPISFDHVEQFLNAIPQCNEIIVAICQTINSNIYTRSFFETYINEKNANAFILFERLGPGSSELWPSNTIGGSLILDVLPEFFRTSQRKLDEGRNSPAINVFSELAVQAWRPKNKNENSVPAEMFMKTARMNKKRKTNIRILNSAFFVLLQ